LYINFIYHLIVELSTPIENTHYPCEYKNIFAETYFMKKTLPVLVLLFCLKAAVAQDPSIKDLQGAASKTIAKDPKDTSTKTWKKGGLFNLNFGQTSLSNWSAGGDKLSLNINSLLNLYAFYTKGRKAWDNSLDVALGYVKTTSLGNRKSDDRIDLFSKYGYRLSNKGKWYTSAVFNFRTQFAPGFNYPSAAVAVKNSQFLSPAYVLLSLGIDYKPTSNFSVFVSPLTSRWVIVNAEIIPGQKGGFYGVPIGKTVNNEMGAFLSANFMKEIAKNITYKSKLDLFSNYKRKPGNVDLFMTNLLSANIFKGISANIGLDLIYDDDVRLFGPTGKSPGTQLRQYFGIGYLKKF
jgi:hypothetical protein